MFNKDDEKFMRLAIEKTREGITQGQTPFGACIVKDGQVIACDHNVVWGTTDITAHGEIHTIREACAARGSIDLSGSTIYSTTEPCPMCFSAIHWARIQRIVYGASIADAQRAGFNELAISNVLMKKEGGSPVVVEGGCLVEECVALFEEWKNSGKAKVY
ncbi:MAG: nucleoside deaminase [Candidatus Omnitrophica bacterium]|nr:nucleoside deaminase [Candidatus Omnitrophota bacterium]